MVKTNRNVKYIFGFLLVIGVALSTYFALTTNKENDEIAISPSSSDELSSEELKTTLIAAKNGDVKSIDKLVSHYGTFSDTAEGEKEHQFWSEKLKDAARAGNPEAKNHFPNGNPDE